MLVPEHGHGWSKPTAGQFGQLGMAKVPFYIRVLTQCLVTLQG